MATAHRFPTGGEYQEAVQHPDRCFADPDLRSAMFERMAMGLPKLISGNFASVFPMTTASGHRYAVKCFTREVPHQLQRYRMIGQTLGELKPWWATDFQFLADGIQVDAGRYPILRMNWVSGLTLTRWIGSNISQPVALKNLAQRFDQLVSDLAASGLAHGDLQDGNLLVAGDGKLHLVDYDGMYVPGLGDLPAGEVGHPDYQPPGRSQADYGPAMDRFSAWLISLSLKMLVAEPALWNQLNPGQDEYLLLNRADLADMRSSRRFSVLASHRNAEVRSLVRMARDILALPLTSMPALVAAPRPAGPGPAGQRPRGAGDGAAGGRAAAGASTAGAAAGGIPGWMRSHPREPPVAPAPPGPAASAGSGPPPPGGSRAASLSGLARTLAALPLAAAAGFVWSLAAGLALIAVMAVLAAVTMWTLYRRDPATRAAAGLRRARSQAASGVKRASAQIAGVQKRGARVDREARRLAGQHTRKRAAVQSEFGRKERRVAGQLKTTDRQLARLASHKQHEISRRLIPFQQAYVTSCLSRATLDGNQIPGVGPKLVARLRAEGIRTAGDFTGLKYSQGGATGIVSFRQASGRLVHVPGIGQERARRIDLWRHGQVASAVRRQPSALPAAELRIIDAQFAAQERRLREERARVTQQIAGQVAAIRQERDGALAAADKQQQDAQNPIDQRRTELAAELGQAYAGRLAAQQELSDRDSRLAAATRTSFARFVGAALRG
jgi:hypothetical protein